MLALPQTIHFWKRVHFPFHSSGTASVRVVIFEYLIIMCKYVYSA